jgi:putative peptidoglycan lipid II flippase
MPHPAAAQGDAAQAQTRRGARPIQAAMFLAATYFLARVIGLLQYTVINSKLPAASSAAYYAAFQVPDIVNYLVAGGAISSTFIPIYTGLLQRDRREAFRFFSTVATFMGLALLAIIIGSMLLAGPLVRLTNTGFTAPEKAATLALTIGMTRILLPAQLFFYLGGMLVGVLNANRRFGATGFTGAAYNVVAIALGLLLLGRLGPISFAWGILLGAFTGYFLLPFLAVKLGPRDEQLVFRPSFNWRNPHMHRFFLNALPIMFGVSLPVVDQMVVGWFASFLPVQAVPHLWTGYRFMQAPLSILAQAASVAAFPYLAAEGASKNYQGLADFLRTGLRRLMFIALPVSTLLIVLAYPIINIFCHFGHYQKSDVHETAVVFAFYSVGLFAWAGQQLVARGFYALQDTRTPTLIGSALTIVFFIPLCALLRPFGGALGLALATSIGATTHFACMLIAFEAKLRGRSYNVALHSERVLGTMLRTLAATTVMGLCGLVAMRLGTQLFPDNKFGNLLNIVFTSALASWAFVAACRRFRVTEWTWLLAKVQARLAHFKLGTRFA